MLDHTQVMGHKEVGKAVLLLKLIHQVEDLRLYGYVKGGNGLVQYDKRRV